MSSITDLKAGTRSVARSPNLGIGVDISQLSTPALKALAFGIVHHGVTVFVDSGAFSLFRSNIREKEKTSMLSLFEEVRAAEWKVMDFDKVFEKYGVLEDEIAEENASEESFVQPYFVMPDVIGDQEVTIGLYEKYRIEVAGRMACSANNIVPLQAGKMSLAEVYRRIVSIVGTERFVVGIPSQEAAVSQRELADFLNEIRPARIHFLGAVSPSTLANRLMTVANSAANPQLSADGNMLRSKMYGKDVPGITRGEKISSVLWSEKIPDDPYDMGIEAFNSGIKPIVPSDMPDKPLMATEWLNGWDEAQQKANALALKHLAEATQMKQKDLFSDLMVGHSDKESAYKQRLGGVR